MDLFALLAGCLGPDETLHVELRRHDADLSVLLLPHFKNGPEAPDPALRQVREALAVPLRLRGTPEALDRDLPAALADYAVKRGALREAATDLETLDAALQNARRATDAKKRTLARSGPGAAADRAEATDRAEAGGATAPAAVGAVAVAANPDSLF